MVKYTFANDPSGYGQAARSFITALFFTDIPLTLEEIKQVPETSHYGIQGDICHYLNNKDIRYQIKIIHLTPDLIPQYREKGIYTISHLFWETSQLPQQWIQPLNEIDEIWTASEQMANMIKKSGVKTLIKWFPQPILTMPAFEKIVPFEMNYSKDFTFYSIFQWIERKNPKGLLTAYWKEFEENNDVTLLLKTYRIFYAEQERNLIKQDILNWKKELNLKHYPKVYIALNLLSQEQIWKFHALGDCFIQPSSGEGWSRPTEEAMLLGNPVISGNNGGITDIIPTSCYFEVPSRLQRVTEVSWIPWYTREMDWKVLEEDSLREKMRFVYTQQEEAKNIGLQAKDYVLNNFSMQKVGEEMRNRLEEIKKFL